MIMHGKHKQEINGYNAMRMIPSLKELMEDKNERFPGLIENLILKTSTSN